jgi:16S rRNA (cytidine1402-2'-O)-methyltransferase
MKVSEALEIYRNITPKGEFVIVVEGKKEEIKPKKTLEMAIEEIHILTEKGIKLIDACKIVSENSDFRKSDLYNYYIKR